MKESGEMYLESIYLLSKAKQGVRSIDVAEMMNYSKPSVSRAMGILRNNGYIEIDAKGYITLTQSGVQTAEKIYERHTILTEILKKVGVDEKTAEEDACRIEHIISDQTFKALTEYFK